MKNAPEPTVPSVLSRDYVIEGVLGQGACGRVYAAVQRRLKRRVALKLLLPDAIAHESLRHRFRDEARAVASISHPNVVQIFDHGVDDEVPWIAYEFVEGGDLNRYSAERRFTVLRVLEIVEQIAQGLAAAHRCGVIHRDLKPANVLLADEQVFKLADFGMARWDGRALALTRTGAMVGTPYYLAPETVVDSETSVQSDLYALGVIIHELLTGAVPYTGRFLSELLEKVARGGAPPPSRMRADVPPAVDALTQRLLARDPSARPPDAAAVADELRRLIRGFSPVVAAPRLEEPPGLSTLLNPAASPRTPPVRSGSGGHGPGTGPIMRSRMPVGRLMTALVALSLLGGLALRSNFGPPAPAVVEGPQGPAETPDAAVVVAHFSRDLLALANQRRALHGSLADLWSERDSPQNRARHRERVEIQQRLAANAANLVREVGSLSPDPTHAPLDQLSLLCAVASEDVLAALELDRLTQLERTQAGATKDVVLGALVALQSIQYDTRLLPNLLRWARWQGHLLRSLAAGIGGTTGGAPLLVFEDLHEVPSYMTHFRWREMSDVEVDGRVLRALDAGLGSTTDPVALTLRRLGHDLWTLGHTSTAKAAQTMRGRIPMDVEFLRTRLPSLARPLSDLAESLGRKFPQAGPWTTPRAGGPR